MDISSISTYSAAQDYPNIGLRSQYLGALSIALRSGDTLSAQQALLGFVGAGGVLSPSSLYGQVKQSLETGDKSQMTQLSNTIDSYRKSGPVSDATSSNQTVGNSSANLFINTNSQAESTLLVSNGIGSFVNASA